MRLRWSEQMAVMNKIEGMLAKEEGIEFYTGVNGFSLLTNTYQLKHRILLYFT